MAHTSKKSTFRNHSKTALLSLRLPLGYGNPLFKLKRV